MKKITVDDTITIIGGSGFVGKNIVKELASTGARIKIVARNSEISSELMTTGYVGQIAYIKCDAKDTVELSKAIQDSTYVINLVGILYQSGRQKFNTMHIKVANSIAEACAKHGIERLIHFSALGIDQAKTSLYAQTKLEGEKVVHAAFPKAIILRPSVIFGPEDNFINKFDWLSKILPFLPLIGGGNTKLQPVYIGDLAKLVHSLLIVDENSVSGKTFEIAGPSIYSMKEIYQMILETTGRKRPLIKVPFWLVKLKAIFLALLPKPLLTPDQVELLKYDNCLQSKNALEIFGIAPTAMEAIIPTYLISVKKLQINHLDLNNK